MEVNCIYPFLTSLVITALSIPSIIRVAELKNLFDEPHSRKSHSSNVPTLGGMAIFAGLTFSISFWTSAVDFAQMKFILSSMIIVFFMGLKDDIVDLVPYKKLLAQLVASFVIVYWGDIKVNSMFGLFGIYEIPYFYSVIFTVFLITFITNAFNLIDGINLLAGSIGLLCCVFFGVWFAFNELDAFAVLSLSMAGALTSFMYYNKTPSRIFMGDTGSLLLGFLVSILAVTFVEFNRLGAINYPVRSAPAIAIAVLIIPIFDTFRVSIIRLLNGENPMKGDRNHLHHNLLKLGLSHELSTASLFILNVTFIGYSWLAQGVEGEMILFSQFLICCGVHLALQILTKKGLFRFNSCRSKS